LVKKTKQLINFDTKVRHSIILFSEILLSKKRLDASFYDFEAKIVREVISKCKLEKKTLFDKENGFIKTAFYPNRFKRIFADDGYEIFQPGDIMYFQPRRPKKISKKTETNFELISLKENTIVLTRSGTVGFCSIVTDTLKNKLFSDDLIRMTLNDDEDLGYVYAFLKTYFGKKLITTNNYGSVISHLEPEHLSTILVPVPLSNFRIKINKNIKLAFSLRDEANQLLDSAEKLLMEKLNLKLINKLFPKYYESNNTRNFQISFSKLQNRLDTSFHLPIVDEIHKQLKKTGLEILPIGDKKISKEIILPGRFKRFYVEKEYGVPFIGGKQMIQFDPQNVKHLSIKNHDKRIQKELSFEKNMILITCSGTIGRVLLAPKYFDAWTGSQHIIRIIPSKDMNAGYLLAFLASDYGHQLILRHSHGSNVDEITDVQVASIKIPLPEPKVMNAIGDLVLLANEKRTKAFHLEKNAIYDVEEMIKNS